MYEILWLYFGRLLIFLALICTVALKFFEDSSFVDGKLSTKQRNIYNFYEYIKTLVTNSIMMHCILEHCKNHGTDKYSIYCQNIFANIRYNEHVEKESSFSTTLVGMQ